MNKRFLSFIALFLPLICVAQDIRTGEGLLSFGINGGATFSQMRFTPSTIRQNIMQGYQGGFTIRYISEKYIGIQLDLTFDEVGWLENNEGTSNRFQKKIRNVHVPIYSHFYYDFSRYFGVNLDLGPYISYVIKEETDANYSNLDNPLHSLSVQNKLGYGIAAGIGLEFSTKIGMFGLGVKYRFGLSDIFNNTKKDPIRSSSPMGLSASISYLIPYIRL